MKKTLNEEITKMRKILGLKEDYDINSDYIDDISAAKSSARRQQDFNQDAIDYVGGEDEWNKLSSAEQDSVLSDIERDWDRSRSMGEDINEIGYDKNAKSQSEGGLGSSIDERMMSPMNIALKIVEDLPEDYDDAMVNAAVEEYIKEAPVNKEVADRYMASDDWWASVYAKIDKVKTQGFNESDEPNTYTDDDRELDRDSGFDDDVDEVRVTIPLMSALSDIQERAPELRERINFIKALVQKMGDKEIITTSELNDLEKQFDVHSY